MIQSSIYEFYLDNFKEILVCENSKECEIAKEPLEFLGIKTFILPDFRAIKGDDLRSFNKELVSISKNLSEFYKCSSKKVLISPIRTILNKLPTSDQLMPKTINFGDSIDFNSFKDELLRLGYSEVDVVQSSAEFSFRGDIIDICSLDEKAYRILLDFDQIESIKELDIYTQLSKNELESIEIVPFLANLSKDEFKNIKDINIDGFWEIENFKSYLDKNNTIFLHKFNKDEIQSDKDLSFLDEFEIISEPRIYRDLEISINNEFLELNQNRDITLIARNDALLNLLNINKNIKIIKSDVILNIGSNKELIISLNKKIPKTKKRKSSLIVDELRVGDLVVHQNYGLAKFSGLELLEIMGAKKEFITLMYQNSDKLLLPVENLDLIDRYIGSNVILDKLGKASFLKVKQKAREKLFIIASKILSLAAKRELESAKFIDTPSDQDKFMLSAKFDYTPDQIKAIDDILSDFKSQKIMDRLLCGDVGFGKTEVAMNAIFACVRSGFKALFFVPTTLLCKQHFDTLKARLNKFDIEVLRFDRFCSAKEKNEVKKALNSDKALVCVGTHALLGVKVNNLGLIIIDEEHKFGVNQKEKLKELSSSSHLLSMSATPIPRSLNMALSSIKSYSALLSAPELREDIRSFLKEYDEVVIKEAILRELRRGGQIFYIHNHIDSLEAKKKELLEILPNLKILILHSKIDSKVSEEEMINFLDKKYDLLLCTSIVESGIHIPNANTILIENSNKFGIADLHQLRGRVGRSDKEGYCYFLIEGDISKESLKRLNSLVSNSYLGAGSTLAYHDLEIRGAGNLIGEAQSGHIENIGYSLYLKMLEDEINKLVNKEEKSDFEIELKLIVNAYLNSDFIKEDRLRLDLYRRLSLAKDVISIINLQSEIEDRFGKLDIYTKNFINLMIIKRLAIEQNIKSISNYKSAISLTYIDDKKVRLNSKDESDESIIEEVLIYLRRNK